MTEIQTFYKMGRKKKILPDHWNGYIDSFYRDHKERAVNVEFYGEDVGKEIIVYDMPLKHLGYISGNQNESLIISFGIERTEFTHIIEAPKTIWEINNKSGRVISLEVIDEYEMVSVIRLNQA